MKQDPPASPQGLSLETVKPIAVKRLESGTGEPGGSLQLAVRLVPEDKQTIGKWLADTGRNLWRDSWARCLIIFIFVALLALVFQRVWFFPTVEPEYTIGPFTVFAQYPKWIAPRDEESISITLLNDGNADLTQVKVLLIFTDTLCLLTDKEGSTVVEFEDLALDERKTRAVNFRLERVPCRCPIQVQARLISMERGMESTAPFFTIQVISVPHYKTRVQRVLGVLVGFLGIVLGLCFERFSFILGLKK